VILTVQLAAVIAAESLPPSHKFSSADDINGSLKAPPEPGSPKHVQTLLCVRYRCAPVAD